MVRSISGPSDPPEALLSARTDHSGGSGNQLLGASPALEKLAIETPAGPRSAAQSRSRKARMGPRLALLGSDIMVLAACEILALSVVHQAGSGTTRSIVFADALLSILLVVVMVLSFLANGLYPRTPGHLFRSSFTELRDIGFALGVTGLVVLGIVHLAGSVEKQATITPATIVGTLLLAAIAIPTGRIITRRIFRAVSAEKLRVLIIGTGMMTQHLARYLSWDPRIVVIGCVDDDPMPGAKVLGSMNDLVDLCDKYDVDQVMVSFSRTHPADAILRLQSLNDRVAISMVPRYFELITWRSHVREIAGLALIDVAPAHLDLGSRVVKRSFDLLAGGLSLVVCAPLLVGTAIAVKVSSRGPVLFRQERIGKGGMPFVMYKFRTMSENANQEREELEHRNEMEGGLFKIRDDPRMTSVGAFLRRTSIDEMPQLFNVLRGDMALVGPRPFIPSESNEIDGSAVRRFEVRPGITGLWQVSGRSHLTFEELRRLDYLYVASWSFGWDLRILWDTPRQVLRGHGAF